MEKIRFGLIGSGWRAEFYIRIAKLLPSLFELTGVMVRNPEKGLRFAKQHGVPVVNTLEELLATSPDFVVLSISRKFTLPTLERLFEAGMPVLCETPPAETEEQLVALWECFQRVNGRIQVAEQYLLQPLYTAWEAAIQQGLLGNIENINISSLHGYHAVSIIRRYLGVGFGNCQMQGKRYTFHVVETLNRQGLIENGELQSYQRDRLTMEFDNGTVAFFDFSSPAQYHSLLRTRQLTVQGTRGEIDDLSIRYLTESGRPVTQTLNRVDFGIYNNQEWAHYGLFLGERELYKSPLFPARLNDDELAVASCMQQMALYVRTGAEFYPLREALQDAYFALVMEQALQQPNQIFCTNFHPWV